MLKIAICDDIPDHLQKAETMVRDYLNSVKMKYEILTFHNAEELLSETDRNSWRPDIAVLDIEMDGENGISLAGRLNEKIPHCRIIFLTSYIDYAPDVYETEHIWFVVKKRADEHFAPAMQKALKSLKDSETSIPAIIVRENGSSVAVSMDRILYISKVGRKAYIKCTDGEYSDARRPALLIPDHLREQFIQCHQGYWLNAKMIRELDHEEFILQDGTHIPISRTFRDSARKQFFRLFSL